MQKLVRVIIRLPQFPFGDFVAFASNNIDPHRFNLSLLSSCASFAVTEISLGFSVATGLMIFLALPPKVSFIFRPRTAKGRKF